jgi:4-diphosphocytidyl-2-C-methyl-D-erythritol kinase
MTLKAPAKINLALHVGARRPDGYHDVTTILQALALADTLTAVAAPGPFSLAVTGADVPADRANLAWRAAERLWQAAGRTGEPHGARLRLVKRIPAAAGLGGGSADAAAALVALNRTWRLRWSVRQLIEVAASLGADVPFALVGGTAIGVGRGDQLFPLADIRPHHVLVIMPAFGVATADAYRWLEEDRARAGSGIEARGTGSVDLGWPAGPVALVNDLAPPVVRRHPEVARMIEACLGAGAVAAAMTGSGSAVVGLFRRGDGSRAARRLRLDAGWRVLSTQTLTRRETRRLMGL